LSSPSRAGKNGGVAFGRFVKLFGNFAVLVLAIAEAFKMANGFFPVKEFPCPPPLTKLLVPLVFVVLVIPFGWELDTAVPYLPYLASRAPFIDVVAIFSASALNCSMLYSVSRIFSLVTVDMVLSHSVIIVNIFFFKPLACCDLMMFLIMFSEFCICTLSS